MGGEPLADFGGGGAFRDETSAFPVFRDVVVLFVRQRFHFVSAGLDGGFFGIDGLVSGMRLDQTHVLEHKFHAPGRS